MKTLRKPLAWLLAMLMLVSVLAACQTGPADGETTEDTTAVDTPAETDPGSTDTKLDFTITVKLYEDFNIGFLSFSFNFCCSHFITCKLFIILFTMT